MNIVEAAKTGKRFRRRGQLDWFPSPRFEGEEYYFNFEELVADDWEVENPVGTITSADFDDAVSKMLIESHYHRGVPTRMLEIVLADLKKKLGL